MFTTWGLGLIAIAWLVQLGLRGSGLRTSFLVLYGAGTALLAWAAYSSGGFNIAFILHSGSLVAVAMILKRS